MKVAWKPGTRPRWSPQVVRRKDRTKGAEAGAQGRAAHPMSEARREANYRRQGGPRETPAQRRRRKHKTNAGLGRLRAGLYGRRR